MRLMGVNCNKMSLINNDFRAMLQHVVDCGFTSCELSQTTLPFLVGGELSYPVIEYAKKAMAEFPLNYTAHICDGLDLRSKTQFPLFKKTLHNAITLCSELGIKLLTVHFEEKSKIAWVEKRFVETYAEAADYAQSVGVFICIENIEVEDYNYVIDIVKEIDHPHFKMTLDVGHLNLACHYFDQDFKAAIEKALPYLKNVHLNDNTGDFMEMRLTDFLKYKMVPMQYRTTYGMGDIHVPPYFGTIDFDYVIGRLKTVEDLVFTCEYERNTYKFIEKEVFKRVNKAING